MRKQQEGVYYSKVYTDRPAYADFEPLPKFQAIQGEELPGSYGGEDLYLLSKGVGIDYDGFWWSLSDHDVSITSYYLKEYFDKARQARFEFGETPKANMEAA